MGLYSAFVGSFVYLFFGSTNYISVGPTAALAIGCISYSSPAREEYTVLLCFLTGIVTLCMGIFQLGKRPKQHQASAHSSVAKYL
jgi:sodium-independent sulfate anion transporter 11